MEPVGVGAGGGQQFLLPRRERPDLLARDQVQDHPVGSERRLELVGNQREEIVLRLVEAAQPGHVGQDDGGADGPAGLVQDRDGAGQEETLRAVLADFNRRFVPAQLRGVARVEDAAVQVGQPGSCAACFGGKRLDVHARRQPEQSLGRIVGQLDDSLRIDDDDGVGKAVDGQLRGPLGPHQPLPVAAPVGAELGGHVGEGDRQRTQLVARLEWHGQLEVAALDFLDRLREQPHGPEDEPPDQGRENNGERPR